MANIMKQKALKILALLIVFISITIFLLVLGGPINRTLLVKECKTEYTYFITNNLFCNYRTSGHCPDNEFEIINAENSVGQCLCEKFESSKSKADSMNVVEYINTNERIVKSYKQLTNNSEIMVSVVCKNKDELFGSFTIE
jgi:hypothetical protein